MRYFLYPRLRKGMDARYALIKGGHDEAEQVTDVGPATTSPSTRRSWPRSRPRPSSASTRPGQTLEAERSERLAEVNARIADKRAAAATEVEKARAAAQADVENAVGPVAARAGELATGPGARPRRRQPGRRRVMSAGVAR